MSRHIWLNERGFEARVADLAWDALRHALDSGMRGGFDPVMRWVGYYVEAVRQKGRVRLNVVWRGVVKSKHRYATGRHRDNYHRAGVMLIQANAGKVGLTPDAPAEVVWDKLMDMREDG